MSFRGKHEEMDRDRELSGGMKSQAEGPDRPQDAPAEEERTDKSRRGFLHASAKKAAYAAPVVLLFRPKPAVAGSGQTQITQA